MVRIGTLLVMLAAGGVWYAFWGEDPQTSACLREVAYIDKAYRASLPKADFHKSIENTLKHARNWCQKGDFDLAGKAVDMAAFLCVGGKGCQPLVEEAKLRRTAR